MDIVILSEAKNLAFARADGEILRPPRFRGG